MPYGTPPPVPVHAGVCGPSRLTSVCQAADVSVLHGVCHHILLATQAVHVRAPHAGAHHRWLERGLVRLTCCGRSMQVMVSAVTAFYVARILLYGARINDRGYATALRLHSVVVRPATTTHALPHVVRTTHTPLPPRYQHRLQESAAAATDAKVMARSITPGTDTRRQSKVHHGEVRCLCSVRCLCHYTNTSNAAVLRCCCVDTHLGVGMNAQADMYNNCMLAVESARQQVLLTTETNPITFLGITASQTLLNSIASLAASGSAVALRYAVPELVAIVRSRD